MLIAGAVAGSAPRIHAEAELANGIQAIVHDSVVTLGEIYTLTQPLEELLFRQYGGQRELFLKMLSDARNDNLKQLVTRKLILHDFNAAFDKPEKQEALEKILNKDVDRAIELEIAKDFDGKRMKLIKTLQAEGITLERHRQMIRDRILLDQLRHNNITSGIIVSPRRVEAYYAAHRDEFKMQEEVKLRMIVLNCPAESEAARIEKLAEEVLAKLKDGATFAEMATIYSEGPERSQGGYLGSNTLSGWRKDLADAAVSLQAGQHSGVMSRTAGNDYWVLQYDNGVATVGRHYAVDTVLGKDKLVEERRFESATAVTNLPPPTEFYLMLVEDKRPPRFKTLTQVRKQIEADLQAEERILLEKQWIAKLRKKTFVRTF